MLGAWPRILTVVCIVVGVAGSSAAAKQQKSVGTGSLPDPKVVLWEDGVKNAYPRWSKDGRRILYQSNGGGNWRLWLMDRKGSNRVPVTDGASNDNFPDWSPDNKWIAFVSDRGGDEDIYIMKPDGSGLRNLTNNPARDIHPYWSPDGRAILFNSTRDGSHLQIYEVTVATGETRRLVDSPDDDSCARISPRGDRILYLANLAVGRDDVLLRNRDGSNAVNLTNDPARDGWPAWTPSADRIVYSAWGSGSFSLFSMKADGADRRRITSPPAGDSDGRAMVSSDGKTIVFNRDHGDRTIGILTVALPS